MERNSDASPVTGVRALGTLLIVYAVASLAHFAHNAEFLTDYPGLPASWSTAGVYLAWVGMTAIGATGWILVMRRYRRTGLAILLVYALAGIASLGHYAVAPFPAHTIAMNATILFEVLTASLVLTHVLANLARTRAN